MLNELSLFSGYGGLTLGLRLAGINVRTVAYVEIEPYCQQIIKARIRDGALDDAPIFPDVLAFDGRQCRGVVDIVTASFPCQPFSVVGQRRGKDDDRNLWPATLRVIRDVGPSYVLLENVRGLANGFAPYAAEIIGELSEAGYDAQWGLLPAAAVGAPHLRWRWWCLAYTADAHREPLVLEQQRRRDGTGGSGQADIDADGINGAVAYAPQLSQRKPHHQAHAFPGTGRAWGVPVVGSWWQSEPDVGRVADGVAARVDRLTAIGNGVVPAVVAEFLRRVTKEGQR